MDECKLRVVWKAGIWYHASLVARRIVEMLRS
jgi:hypothetical protein